MDDDGRMDSQTTSADENLRALCDAIRSSGGLSIIGSTLTQFEMPMAV